MPQQPEQPNNVDALRGEPHRSALSWELQILGIGKRPIRDVFVCTSPHFAKILAKDKYGDWIRFGEVKEVLTRAQKKAKAAAAAEAALLNRAEAKQPRSRRWQPPAEVEGPPTYLWG